MKKKPYISQDEETSGEIVVESEGETIEEPIEEAKISNIKILAVGDIMFHSPQYIAAFNKEINEYDFTSVFKYVKKYIESVD